MSTEKLEGKKSYERIEEKCKDGKRHRTLDRTVMVPRDFTNVR